MNRVYRQIQAQDRFFGLEVADFLVLIVFFVFVLNLSSGIIFPIFLTGIAYSALWSAKRRKPSGWTQNLMLFLKRPKYFSAAAHDTLTGTYPYVSKEAKEYAEKYRIR